jgi:hypothetical protein
VRRLINENLELSHPGINRENVIVNDSANRQRDGHVFPL